LQLLNRRETKKTSPTINDLKILTRMLYAKGDAESIQFQALLVLQWQMLGRSIDCCWIQKRQVLVMPGGDMIPIVTAVNHV
jgi:hypothetical protein